MSYAVVILSRTASNLEACVEAIQASGCKEPIFCVWDGKLEDVLENGPAFQRPSAFSGVVFVSGVKPFVFARNANIGIAAAAPRDVILCNDDALLQTPNGFNRLHFVGNAPLPMSAGGARLGVVSASILGAAAAPEQNYGPTHMNMAEGDPRSLILARHHMLAFVCVHFRRQVLEELGPLDERFIGYGFDDDDYCRRLTIAGYRLGIAPGVMVEHGSLPSTFRGQGRAAGSDMLAQNRQLFSEKWGE